MELPCCFEAKLMREGREGVEVFFSFSPLSLDENNGAAKVLKACICLQCNTSCVWIQVSQFHLSTDWYSLAIPLDANQMQTNPEASIAVFAVASTGRASFVYRYVQTKLRGQYNGKWPFSLIYVLKPLITAIREICIIFWEKGLGNWKTCFRGVTLFQDTFEEQQTFPVCRLYIEAHVPHILNQVDDSGLATNEGTTETIFRVPGIKATT